MSEELLVISDWSLISLSQDFRMWPSHFTDDTRQNHSAFKPKSRSNIMAKSAVGNSCLGQVSGLLRPPQVETPHVLDCILVEGAPR